MIMANISSVITKVVLFIRSPPGCYVISYNIKSDDDDDDDMNKQTLGEQWRTCQLLIAI